MDKVKKQYGLWTGIAMVVGIVIGSGVFFKAGGVLQSSGGDLKFALLAWLIGGLIMITSGFCFAIFATKITKFNGVVDYVELATNKKIGYFLAWLMTTFYYPIIASIVSLFSGQYFFKMFGLDVGLVSWQNVIFASCVLTASVILNYLSPIISAKFQVSSTIIKLIPILIVAVVGLFASIIVGSDYGIINAFKVIGVKPDNSNYVLNFGEAVKKTAFAYEGWVCATSINAELKESHKNLPQALVFGTVAILVFYLIYFISLSAFLGNTGTINSGNNAPIDVFEKIMGKFGGALFAFFLMVSCLGTVNGVTISCCRGMYTMSCRGQGIAPEKFSKLGKNQSVSLYSCIYGYICILFMLMVWCLAINGVWLFKYLGSMDEIICAIIYLVYITMYIYMMKNFKDQNVLRRFIFPALAIVGSIFFTICGTGIFQLITTGEVESLKAFGVFMIFFVLLMLPSIFFYKKEKEMPEESL
ncbi:MAG: hypothetical protein BHW12_03555 [Coprobacillus sp. 28_7]|nr:MAG: hypothetical protein BHW12_03555 [Coprobacillus sp. 28_7]